ncbi:hypothetical protein O3P69_013096 [Scylla paramamosain]|uniref:Uncharacterized protein n=1 Tax=Scylla paramamosain TaxID=85552 RepID=A0AAW0SIB7_SCYPA
MKKEKKEEGRRKKEERRRKKRKRNKNSNSSSTHTKKWRGEAASTFRVVGKEGGNWSVLVIWRLPFSAKLVGLLSLLASNQQLHNFCTRRPAKTLPSPIPPPPATTPRCSFLLLNSRAVKIMSGINIQYVYEALHEDPATFDLQTHSLIVPSRSDQRLSLRHSACAAPLTITALHVSRSLDRRPSGPASLIPKIGAGAPRRAQVRSALTHHIPLN